MRPRKTAEEKSAARKAYYRTWYLANHERQLLKGAEYRAANKEKVNASVKKCLDRYDPEVLKEYLRQYYIANREKLKTRAREWTKENYGREEVRQAKSVYGRKWRELNPALNCAKSNKRRAAILRRRPCWLSPIDECRIQEFYEIANARSIQIGIEHHVDHIIPLQGKTVSGLHVPNNLQVISGTENMRKHNLYC